MFGEKNLFKLQFANALKLCALFSLTLYQSSLLSQDTVALKNVVIISTKNQLFRIGKKTEVIDSNAKASFRMNSIGDILSFNSPVFIKSYGPGALATTAFATKRHTLDPSALVTLYLLEPRWLTTSATLPLLLADYEGQLKKGDNLIFAAFGGGFTWGAIYLKWAYNKQ